MMVSGVILEKKRGNMYSIEIIKALNNSELKVKKCTLCHGSGYYINGMDVEFCRRCDGTGEESNENKM